MFSFLPYSAAATACTTSIKEMAAKIKQDRRMVKHQARGAGGDGTGCRRKETLVQEGGEGMKKLFKKYYACPHCGRAISGEKRSYFACPNCGSAICRKKDIKSYKDKHCGNCGYDLSSAKKRALALLREEERA